MENKQGMPDTKQRSEGVVEFESFDKIKKKQVRGFLRKRAKKYECKISMIRCKADDSEDEESKKSHPKKKILKNSFSSAFQQIMGKKITETH